MIANATRNLGAWIADMTYGEPQAFSKKESSRILPTQAKARAISWMKGK